MIKSSTRFDAVLRQAYLTEEGADREEEDIQARCLRVLDLEQRKRSYTWKRGEMYSHPRPNGKWECQYVFM